MFENITYYQPVSEQHYFCCAANSINISYETFTHLNRTAPSATVSQAVNFHLKVEMFRFHSKYFVYRELKRAPQKLSFCFKWPDTYCSVEMLDVKCDSFQFRSKLYLKLFLVHTFIQSKTSLYCYKRAK